jgi:RHS repeat-associated protein
MEADMESREAPAPGSRVGTILAAPPPQSDQNNSPRTSINLPKGGGAIRGVGEKFSANPATGSGSLTVPIAVSSGRSGFGPQLNVSYDSGSGNGPFGFGWNFSLPSITRKTDKGLPQYIDAVESDTFLLSGAEDLVPSLVQSGAGWEREILPTANTYRNVYGRRYSIHRYRPRVEGLFSRIERWTNPDDPQDTFWRSITKENVTTWYGKTAESRIADPADPSRIFSWQICESYDDKGNVTIYKYKQENADQVDLTQANERNRTRGAKNYLKRILYGNATPYFPDLNAAAAVALPAEWHFELVFDYGEHDLNNPVPAETGPLWTCRTDAFSTYRSCFEVRTYRLCRRVLMFHHFKNEPDIGVDCLVRSTDFRYAPPPAPYSFLQSVTQTSYRRDGAGGYLSGAMPPVEFRYSEAIVNETVREIDSESLQNLPYGLDASHYRWADLDGEGLSGILTEQGGAWFYKANLSAANEQTIDNATVRLPQFAPVTVVSQKPSTAALGSGDQQFMDLAGDGKLDLVDFEAPAPGFFERTEEQGWEPFTAFSSLPNIDWKNPNLKFIDLSGDGLPDLLITDNDAFVWHASLGEEGYGPEQRTQQAFDEEKGPNLIFADSTESIFLADMSGDGLTDLVRIRNGEVCYWPNNGYGQFGSKVTMDQAPWFDRRDVFDGRRILLADIDGSGNADILYFASNEVHLYFNQSGNAWDSRRVLNNFPAIDSISNATAIDLLGNGTTCLVWSSPLASGALRQMRYIDLMGGQKPHLLTRFSNNLGAETVIRYSPSTKFYVADKLAGTPWVTRLPFPVQVVEQVQTYDYISRSLFATRYSYHHGYFDGVEREFRGFGRVDQFDTESFATLSATAVVPQPVNLDAASNVPPVCTKTWFHTGAFFGVEKISKYFEHEYYREDVPAADQMLLDDTVLPADVALPNGTRLAYNFSGEEEREACRALRGSILRQEVYGLDGSEAEDRPYSVSERNYTIEALQPQGPNPYAVFFIHPRETLDFHYERQLYKVKGNTLDPTPPTRILAADPRVAHGFTFSVDTFGNVLETVAVGYGRRYADPALTLADQDKQRATLSTYVQNTYTNPILLDDSYRAPLIAEANTFELIQVQPDAGVADITNLFSFDELIGKVRSASDGAHDILFEDRAPALNADEFYRRLIASTRTLYRPDDMGAAAGNVRALLPLKSLEPLALRGAAYKLAFTPGLIAQTYQRSGAALLLAPATVLGSVAGDGGGYVDLDGDGRWWVPSGRQYYMDTAPASPQEKNAALLHFFQARRFEDPFGNTGTVEYDNYDLLAIQTTDEASNTVQSKNDYRVLAPSLLTDPNGNRSAVGFDVRGFVTATAVMGKVTENLGDLLTGFQADLTQVQIDGFYGANDPHTVAAPLLGNATTRLVYDLERFQSTRAASPADPSKWQPPFSATISRETHFFALAAGQQSQLQIAFSYSDGFGREIQKKIQAEPGPVTDGGPVFNPRWVGSGWTIFNNKGKPVRQYEPFFSQLPGNGHQFEFGNQMGVSPIAIYDPVQRIVATLNANHTYQKSVFDPWHQDTWDVNDTVAIDPAADPDVGGYFQRLAAATYSPTWFAQRAGGALGPWEQAAATKASAHAGTPTIACFDGLGRTFRTTIDAGGSTKLTTRMELDIQGNQLSMTDALGRQVIASTYNLLQNRIAQSSMDSGATWILTSSSGNAIRAWDSRGHNFSTQYDALRRPVALSVQGTDAVHSDPRTLAHAVVYEKVDYGEGQPHDKDLNLRSREYQHYDPSGVLANFDVNPATGITESFDFKGNLIRSRRTFIDDARLLPDWSAAPAFAPDIFSARTAYDALNRAIASTAPDGSIVTPSYNQANLLKSVDIHLRGAAVATGFISNIQYNAKGQRTQIDYANQAATTYAFDPALFRLLRITTSRQGVAANQQVVQDLSYTFDPVGNITHIQDDADIQNAVFFKNQRIDPSADFIYDALYRLAQSSGRELLSQTATSYNDVPRINLIQPGDGNAMGTYKENYVYDLAGNLQQLIHAGSNPVNAGWSRSYTYSETSLLEPGKMSNRLSATTVNGATPLSEPYTSDPRGNIASMPQLQSMLWDFKDQLRLTQRQAVNQSDQDGVQHSGQQTVYAYDFSGQRARKVTFSAAGAKLKERFYLGGFELYREYGANALERQTLHVMDDKQRIALVETKTVDATVPPALLPEQTIRYQFGNHLGTATLELDENGAVISYEEYYPFGGSAYQAGRSLAEVGLKRYRYLGKERDEETGFNYNDARYYALWLARWISPDPAGLKEGPNPYQYSNNNPIVFSDPGGKQPPSEEPSNGATVGPFQFRNIQAGGNVSLSANISLNNLFSSDRSLTINSVVAGGHLTLVSDTTLTPFGLTGRSSALLSLDSLHIDHQLFDVSLTANATLAAGPFALDLNADATGSSVIDRNISLSSPGDSLRYTLDNFNGSANLFGRFFLRAGPIDRALGAFSLTADSHGTSGVLGFRGYIGLPTLDPGKNINIARIRGEGTFGPGGYDLHGDFRLLLPPVAFATGRFSLTSEQGFSASGHYVGLQFGPLGLTPSFDPLAASRPPNMTSSPGDTPDTNLSRQLSLPESSRTGPAYTVKVLEPGTSIGYTYFNYSHSGTTIFSAGFAPHAQYQDYSREEAPLPSVLGAIPQLDTLLYGHSTSSSAGVYFGVSLTRTFTNP